MNFGGLENSQLPATQPNGTGDRQHLVKKARHNPLKITVLADLEIELQALSCLVTSVIHRLHETDPVWWREFLDDIRSQKNAIEPGTASGSRADKVLTRAISIVERALATEGSSRDNKSGSPG